MEDSLSVNKPFSKDSIYLNAAEEVERISNWMLDAVAHRFHRQGAVVGISGGIDSALVLALCARTFGPDRVVGILLPEKESSPVSVELALELAQTFKVKAIIEDITAALEGFGCYRRRDEAVKSIFPEYQTGWQIKIVLPGDLLEQGTLNVFRLVVTDPDGKVYSKRLPPQQFLQIVAASNFKQRSRMSMLYYHAEMRNYSVIGTGNKNEHDLGFFVKFGDGGADLQPIAHLFKTQVFQLSKYLGVPESIQKRVPTTDTYPGAGSQEEFFYRIPYHLLDTIWLGDEQNIAREEIAKALDLTLEQVTWVIEDIHRKQRTTSYLRTVPLLVDKEKPTNAGKSFD